MVLLIDSCASGNNTFDKLIRVLYVSLTRETYAILDKLSKVLMPDFPGGKLSIAKTIQYIANEKAKKLNGKFKKD